MQWLGLLPPPPVVSPPAPPLPPDVPPVALAPPVPPNVPPVEVDPPVPAFPFRLATEPHPPRATALSTNNAPQTACNSRRNDEFTPRDSKEGAFGCQGGGVATRPVPSACRSSPCTRPTRLRPPPGGPW
jgi:hypothetical protein